MDKFGEKLKKLRISHGLTASALAEMVETSHVTIGNIEKGGKPRFELIRKLANALNVSVDYLTDGLVGDSLKEKENKVTIENKITLERSPPIATITTPSGKRVSIYESEEGVSVVIK